jgi:hypothetical protein
LSFGLKLQMFMLELRSFNIRHVQKMARTDQHHLTISAAF